MQLCLKGPFSGSEVSYAVAVPKADKQRAWDVLAAVQDAMEPLIMVSPPMMVQLRMQGFTDQVVHAPLRQIWTAMMHDGLAGYTAHAALLLRSVNQS